MKLDRFYVYLLIDPRDASVFYVGKGTGSRISDHKRGKNGPRTRNKINKLRKLGVDFEYKIIRDKLEESEAIDAERFTIAFLREIGCELTNLTDGGEGLSGHKHSEESRKKMSESIRKSDYYTSGRIREGIVQNFQNILSDPYKKEKWRKSIIDSRPDVNGEKNPFFGKKHSEETKDILKKRPKAFGQSNPNFGNKWDESQKRKMSSRVKNAPYYISCMFFLQDGLGNIIQVNNLSQWCKANGYNYTAYSYLLKKNGFYKDYNLLAKTEQTKIQKTEPIYEYI